MLLRWAILERRYSSFDKRSGEYETSCYKDSPVLQYSEDGVLWINVETVVIEVKC